MSASTPHKIHIVDDEPFNLDLLEQELGDQDYVTEKAGDGIMVFFNDPISCPDHAEKALRMALAMQAQVRDLRTLWLKRGYDLDLGIGLATGDATMGSIGFEGRMDYGAVGNVTNLAARLCAEAKGG